MSLVQWDPAIQELQQRYQQEGLTAKLRHQFQQHILHYYQQHGREFPWRHTTNPYAILVSETMLQQTQTHRVVPKYEQFIERFPDATTLAEAPLREVLQYWQGLGYNRRAKLLQQAAQSIIQYHNAYVPQQREQLEKLPGVGPYTATAVRVFAFNQPEIVLETNIRTVYIFFFLPEQDTVTDAQLTPFVETTLYRQSPRDWYNAIMDYGAMVKQAVGNLNKRSESYTKQSRFEGSMRQARGRIIQALTTYPELSHDQLQTETAITDERFDQAVRQLQKERMLIPTAHGWQLA